jgi:hypothetical protein
MGVGKSLCPTSDNCRRRDGARLLEARLKALESRPILVYCGTFEAGRTYERGQAVTWGGVDVALQRADSTLLVVVTGGSLTTK